MRRTRTETSLVRAMGWFAASYAGAIVGYLGLNAAAGRWLGPDDFGYFIAVLSGTGLLAQLGLMGVHRSGLREASRLRHGADPEALVALRNGVRAVSLTTLPLAGVLGAGATWFIASSEPTAARVALAVGVGALVVFTGQQKVWANFLRGFGYVRLAGLLEGRSGGPIVAGLQAALVVGVWQVFPEWGLAGALAAVALGYAFPVLLASRVVHSHWGHLREPRPQLVGDLRVATRRDWRFLSVQLATFLNISLEVWVAAVVLSSVETSMFTAGLRLAQLLTLPMTALQVVLSPVIARMSVNVDDRADLQRLLRTGASLTFAVTLLLCLPILIAPGPVLDLVYGAGFDEAAPALLLLSVAFVVNVLMGLAGTTLSMAGREGVGAQVQWAGVVLRLLVAVPAALLGGVVALAAASSAVSVLVFVTMWLRARSQVGVSTHVTLRPDIRLILRTKG